MTSSDLLVTGTDTGVGKTAIAAAVLLGLRKRGIRAIGFKPVETGLDEPADSEILALASGVQSPQARPCLRLREALAPAVAAGRAGTDWDPREAEDRVRALRAEGYRVVVEGAGGVTVPLAWGYSVLDLAEALELGAVVVARPGLGTLNHIVLTVEALTRRGIGIRGVILNGRSDPGDLAEQTNPGALERLLPGLLVLTLPRVRETKTLSVARALDLSSLSL
jgi:dethiobiotin synthetase